jgi:hypothetical protein
VGHRSRRKRRRSALMRPPPASPAVYGLLVILKSYDP